MKRAITFLCICTALSLASCIDSGFNLADTSGEITVGGEELVVPLAEITPIKLSDLLGENEVIKGDENGVYQIQFSSFGDDPSQYESLSVDGISIPAITGLSPKLEPISFSFQQMPTTLMMSGISQSFEIDYPTLNSIVKIQPIEMAEELNLQLPISGQDAGTISENLLRMLKMQGLDTIKSEYASETVFNAEINILEQLNKIDWVQFGCDIHPYGAPFEIKIDLLGLQDVVGGGTLNVNIEFPEGYYLRDEQGNDFPDATHNILAREIVLQPKQKKVELLVYLNRIDYSDHEFEDGKLKIDDHIKYSYDLNLNLSAGSYNLASMPKFSIKAAPEYKDVEVVINHFDMEKVNYEVNYAFAGMPKGVRVNKVAFNNTYLTLSLKGLEWLHVKDNESNDMLPMQVKMSLPECMNFEENEEFSNNTLSASVDDLAEGIRLKLNHIDCTAEGVTQENGELIISSNIVAEIDLHSMDGHKVLVSSLTPPSSPIKASVAIADTQLNLDIANTEVQWSEDQIFDLNLGDNIPSISQSISVPDMIASVDNITIGKAGSDGEPVAIEFGLAGNRSFPVEELEVDVAINLGKLLRPTQATLDSGIITKNANDDYILAIKEAWRPREKDLNKRIEFEALENIPAIKNGKIAINQSFPVTGSVKIKSGENILLDDEIVPQINIDVKIDDIEARTFTGSVDIKVAPEQMYVELGDMGDLGVNINSLSLNPIFNIKLKDNPTGIPFSANVAVTTFNSEGTELATIIVPTITVAGSGASNIVLSTPLNRAKYETEGVTFVEVADLKNLLSDGIPAKIAVDMSVATDSTQTYTLDLARAAEGYNIEYQYEVIVPLTMSGDVHISYESVISGLGETFAELADTTKGLKVGDVGLIAEFGTTIPFNIVLSAELVNANGTTEGVEARLNINECVIKGCSATTGERSVSKIDLDFDLGDSHSLAGLKNADGILLKFSIFNVDNEAASLMKDQYIDGKLKLRLRNGLTIDIFDFLNGNLEEVE